MRARATLERPGVERIGVDGEVRPQLRHTCEIGQTELRQKGCGHRQRHLERHRWGHRVLAREALLL